MERCGQQQASPRSRSEYGRTIRAVEAGESRALLPNRNLTWTFICYAGDEEPEVDSMPLTVRDVEILKAYIDGVMTRADHHANEVEEIALALTGAIIWKKDDGKDIRVMEKSGDTKNVLWVTMGGQQYAFAYNHAAKSIEMREGNMRGPVLHSFSNTTPLARLHQIFVQL
jgi:hypothetical protein